jgi:hypothetical protein
MNKYVPACLGTELQQPWPCVVMYLTSFSSSSGDHSPLLTFCLLQQEWCPISLTLYPLIAPLLHTMQADDEVTESRWSLSGAWL